MVNTNANMEEIYKAEVECLRKVIKEKEVAIEKLEQTQKQLDKAERILNELAIGHQSRNKYDELIRMGKAYFKELEK